MQTCQNVRCKRPLSPSYLFCPKCGDKINTLPVEQIVTGQSGESTGKLAMHLAESGSGEGATGGLLEAASVSWSAPEGVNLENKQEQIATGQSGESTGKLAMHLAESGSGEGATGGLLEAASVSWSAPEGVNLENKQEERFTCQSGEWTGKIPMHLQESGSDEGATGGLGVAASVSRSAPEQVNRENNPGADGFDGEIEDNELVSFADYKQMDKVLKHKGFSELMKMFDEKNNEYKTKKLDVALVGETGSGKSSLINALLDLKDDDQDAAKTGPVETTFEPNYYLHPNYKNIRFWDLPGVNSRKFPRKDYLKKIPIKEKKYDIVILVSCSRFTMDDSWLAKQILRFQHPDSKLFFVRTKIDSDVRNTKNGRRNPLTKDEEANLLKSIKEGIGHDLSVDGISNPYIFLVNSHNPYVFDFGNFLKTLIEEVSVLKKKTLIMSICTANKEIVPLKIKLLRNRIADVSKIAATAAVNDKHDEELDILKKEIVLYKQQLGIQKDSLNKIAEIFEISRDDLSSSICSYVKDIDQLYQKHEEDTKEDKEPTSLVCLPVFIKWLEFRNAQRVRCRFLQSVLEMCAEANENLMDNINKYIIKDY